MSTLAPGWDNASFEMEEVLLEVDELKIKGKLYYPQGKGPFPALCLCHGIRAHPPDPTDPGYPALAEKFCGEGFLSFFFNFRGTGESEGNFDILGWTRDLKTALDYLFSLEEVDKNRLSIMGFSAGAVVAVYVAAHENRISSLIACGCPVEFTFSPEEMLKQARQVGTIRDPDFPPSFEEWSQGFEQVSPNYFIDKISPRPLLILHGEKDELIETSQAQMLYQKAKQPKKLVFIPEGRHQLRLNQEAMQTALRWLKEVNQKF